jgi:hypothetical protein
VRPQGAGEVTAAERRRGIALVLDRQPEIDLDELQRILGRVGITVDTATLLEDLDALGYDVDDEEPEEDGRADDPAGIPGPDRVVLEEDERGGLGEVDAFADEEPRPRRAPIGGDDEGDEEDAPDDGVWSRQSLVIAAAVVVVVIIVAVFLAGGNDDDGTETTDGGTGSDLATAGGGAAGETTAPTGPTEPVVVAPVGPGSDPALEVPETRTDDFERGDIGDFPDVGTYEVLGGEWTNTDGNLDLAAAADPIALIAVDPGVGDLRAQVQVDRRASRSGLAFRIVDAENFFVWTTVPEFATNILFQVVDGEAERIADSGLTTTGDGLPALGINITGTTVELLNDGVVVATYDGLPPADGATRIGLAALDESDALPLFDELKILTP